jgi:high affinity choline transporter 7
MRIGIVCVSIVATIMGIAVKSVYGLWFLCSDLVYVVLFPQLFCVVYLDRTNTYGSLVAYWVGIFLRLSGGEPLFNLPALIKFPMYDEETMTQRFPFRTMSMLLSFVLNIGISFLANCVFEKGILPKKFDVFRCVTNRPSDGVALKDSATTDELVKLNSAGKRKYSIEEIELQVDKNNKNNNNRNEVQASATDNIQSAEIATNQK